MKYSDSRKARNRATLSTYASAEAPAARHARRLKEAMVNLADTRTWCDKNGWQLDVFNNGHHWVFQKGAITGEWWPSSAKLVISKSWQRGIHCHDWRQVVAELKVIEGEEK